MFFVEVVGSTNINIFQDIFVVVVTTSDGTRVFTFRLQVCYRRTQTEVELVLSNSFKVLCFVRPTQGNLRELRYRSGCTEQPSRCC